mmetsp:Transcript_115640/g.172810  ORF Transcript_115640/g.172810 Transcript_115640/m.172810 type:complete len:273 (-) Transcript_115640:172-990(-)
MEVAFFANFSSTMMSTTSEPFQLPADPAIWPVAASHKVLHAPNFADALRSANATNFRRNNSGDYQDVSITIVHDQREPIWCGLPCTWKSGIAGRVLSGELSLAEAKLHNARTKQISFVRDLPSSHPSSAEKPKPVAEEEELAADGDLEKITECNKAAVTFSSSLTTVESAKVEFAQLVAETPRMEFALVPHGGLEQEREPQGAESEEEEWTLTFTATDQPDDDEFLFMDEIWGTWKGGNTKGRATKTKKNLGRRLAQSPRHQQRMRALACVG